MSDSDLRADVDMLLDENPGLRQKLVAKAVANRQAIHADTRTKKRADRGKFVADRKRVQGQLDAGAAETVAAQKAAEDKMLKEISLRGEFSDIHDRYAAACREHDSILRANADPAIDAAMAKIETLRADIQNQYRVSADGKGDNRKAVQARVVAMNEALEALDRLKVDPDVDDPSAAIAAIFAAIREA